MKVTAIIAAHNYGHWITDCIKSVWDQTYKNINIAIFNDGSSDDTHKVCQKLLNLQQPTGHRIVEFNNKTYNFLHYQGNSVIPYTYILSDKPTGGPSKPRNELIKATWNDTDIFAPLDCDDWWHGDRIQKIVEVFKQDSNIGLVFTDYFTLDIKTGVHQTVIGESYHLGRLMQKDIIHSGACINKNILTAVQENEEFYCEAMRCCEDYDLFMRCCEKSMCIQIPEPLLVARIHDNNSTNSVQKEIWENCWKLMQQRLKNRQQ